MIKLKDILILEDIPDDVTQAFQKIPFGEDPTIAKMTTGAFDKEDNTQFEDELIEILIDWTQESNDIAATTLFKKFNLLKKAAEYFPEVLKPDSPNGTIIYRGIVGTSSKIYQDVELKKFISSDFSKIEVTPGYYMYEYKHPVVYKPNRDVQSWTSDIAVAKRFTGAFLLATKQNDEFLFSQELIRYLYGEEDESEVIHFGKQYSDDVHLYFTEHFMKDLIISEFPNELPKTKEELKQRLKALEIGGYTINDDLSVDFNQDILIQSKNMKSLPFKVNTVNGEFSVYLSGVETLENFPQIVYRDFTINNNKNLKKLKGGPTRVGGAYICQYNSITSLEGVAYQIGNNTEFNFTDNKLISLEHCPVIKGNRTVYNFSFNKLTTLKGAPQKVEGSFRCSHNQLTSLEEAPKEVGGDFNCSVNKLTSLKGCPEIIGGDFNCANNQLTSLKGCPEIIAGIFNCSNNLLTTLRDGPKEIRGYLNCYNNKIPKEEIEWARKNIKIAGGIISDYD